MKKSSLIIALITVGLMSFSSIVTDSYSAKIEKSTIQWKGFKPTGSHNGLISISNGTLVANGNNVITGSFTVDMKSITVLDSDNQKIVNHLKSDDFFEVNMFPTAKFDITGSKKVDGINHIKGFVTIKGVRKEISFPAKISKDELGNLVLESDVFKINRADFNIRYKSKTFYADLKDKFIFDEFELQVLVVASKN